MPRWISFHAGQLQNWFNLHLGTSVDSFCSSYDPAGATSGDTLYQNMSVGELIESYEYRIHKDT